MVHSRPATQEAHYPSLNPKIAQTNNNAGTITNNYKMVSRIPQWSWSLVAIYVEGWSGAGQLFVVCETGLKTVVTAIQANISR